MLEIFGKALSFMGGQQSNSPYAPPAVSSSNISGGNQGGSSFYGDVNTAGKTVMSTTVWIVGILAAAYVGYKFFKK